MKGLEVTIRSLSEVKAEHLFFRLDSEYCQKRFLANAARIKKWPAGFVRLGEELEDITGGATPLGADYPESGVRFLRVQNIMPGYIDDTDMAHTTPADDSELARSRLRTDDVLLTITGVSYGKSAVVTPEFAGSNINQHAVRMHLRPGTFRPIVLSTFLNAAPGKLQSDQNITGVTRPALDYTTIRNFLLPRVSDRFQAAVENCVRSAHESFTASKTANLQAEETLVTALGLGDWQPPQPLTYTRRASEVFAARRLDSQYFAPRVAELIARLSTGGRTLRDVAPARHENFTPSKHGEFRYVEISDVHADGTAGCATVAMRDAPSRATQFVRAGDVLTSTVRPNRRLSAIVSPEQDGCVASSGFVVLQPKAIPAEVLLTYLRLPLFCELMDLHTSASLYPAIAERDLLALPFPKIRKPTCDKIVSAVRDAHAARARARELLARAKRAVEIAIEEGEPAALKFLGEEIAASDPAP